MESSACFYRGAGMSAINGIGNNTPIQPVVNQPVQKPVASEAPSHVRASDKLELSGVSHLLRNLKSSGVRADKVAAVRAQIEAGKYEDEHKLNVAVDRLLDDLNL
jgi:anti-sigma28 factor (negative regulator of flagellin synthesis)